jgi:AcrR family transcriptional regulator
MARVPAQTRRRIIDAANRLFYGEGIRAVSVDAVAAKAGVTKRTLYYHFRSKDDLIAAYLESRDRPNLDIFAKWFEAAEGTLPEKIEAVFAQLAKSARHPKWKGCGFLRTVHELANMPGHPAVKIGASHKKKLQNWLESVLRTGNPRDATCLARQLTVLMDGAFATMLVHRDAGYVDDAGKAARALVEAACHAKA